MEGKDSFVPKVWADQARVCSSDGLHRKIRIEQISPHSQEVEVGRRVMDQEPDKAGDQAGNKIGLRTGEQTHNLKKHRMPMFQSHRLLKTRQKNRRTNNAESLKQYNSSTALPI